MQMWCLCHLLIKQFSLPLNYSVQTHIKSFLFFQLLNTIVKSDSGNCFDDDGLCVHCMLVYITFWHDMAYWDKWNTVVICVIASTCGFSFHEKPNICCKKVYNQFQTKAFEKISRYFPHWSIGFCH